MAGVLNKPRTSAEDSLNIGAASVVSFGPFVFDRVNGLLWREGREQGLPPRAVGVLVRLLERPGDVVSKAELLDHGWKDTFVTEVSLTEAVSLLRQVLGDDSQQPTYIQTIPRRGYRFLAPVQPVRDQDVAEAERPSAAAVPHSEPGVWPGWMPWVLTTVLAAALVAVSVGLVRQRGAGDRPLARFVLDQGDAPAPIDQGPVIAISRDSRHLAWVGRDAAGGTRVLTRELARPDVIAVPGTEGARAPFFSPDGEWIAFFADGALKKVPRAGGEAPATLAPAPLTGGGTWTTGGVIVFSGGFASGLQRVPQNGGRAETITVPDARLGEVRHLWPEATPSGSAVVFTGWPADGAADGARVGVVSLTRGEQRTLVEGAVFGRPLPTGHLLYVREDAVLAAPFDGEALVVQGPARPVLTTVATDRAHGVAHFAFAAPGTLVEITAAARERESWRWLAGTRAITPFEGRAIRSLSVAPRQRLMAAAIGDGQRADVWLGRLEEGVDGGTRLLRLTTTGHNAAPVWSPDGETVTFAVRDDGPFNLFTALAAGTAPPQRLTTSPRNQVPASVGAGGLIYAEAAEETAFDLWLRAPVATGAASATPLVQAPGNQVSGVFSPDGRWLAYQSDASGRWRAHVRAAAEAARDLDLGASAGLALVWTPSSLLFADDRARLVECRPAAVPACAIRSEGVADVAGIASDGRVLVRTAVTGPAPRLEVALEWAKDLTAKVPTRPREVRPVR